MSSSSTFNGHVEDDDMSFYRKDSNSVVTFYLVYSKDDLEKNESINFKPVMSHQIFGENESIFGYRSVTINLYYLHNSSRCYVELITSGKIKGEIHKPDDIMSILNPWLPNGYVCYKEQLMTMIENETHDLIYGKVLHEFKSKQKCHLFPNDDVYATYKVTRCDVNDEDFKNFHCRFETIVIWFIDGANYIDLDDQRWEIFYVYEEVKHPQTKEVFVTPVGFCTAYKFFAYPQSLRCRISQFMILPPFQRLGIGTVLYQTVFNYLQNMEKIIDITVEEPTSTFQRIRDIHDSLLARKALEKNNLKVLRCPSKKIFNLLKEIKFGKKQSQRIHDILCLLNSQVTKDSYNQCIKNIRKRFETEAKEKLGHKKMRKTNSSVADITDENILIEADFKKYKEDLDNSIEYIKKYIKSSS